MYRLATCFWVSDCTHSTGFVGCALRCWMYDVNGSSEAKPFDVNIFGNTEDLTTDIRDIEATTAVVNGNIYSIDGQLVRANATSTANLPMGIYIWNHKKIVIK